MAQRAIRKKAPAAGWVPTVKQGGLWLIATIVVAVVGGFVGSYFTKQDNLEIAYKTQKLADIQTFQGSAKALDDSFRAFNDALVDGKEVDEKRNAVRQAIAQHSSDAYGMERVFGRNETQRYIDGLAKFRREVDGVTGPTNAMSMAQTGIDLIRERQAITRTAEKRIGYEL